MKKLNLFQKISYCGYMLLFVVLFTACDDYPNTIVCEGKENMIVYKIDKCDNPKYGIYRYAVTDVTGVGWTLYSFKKFNIGDTLHISNGY